MLIVALRKGGGPCSKDCPFYSEAGVVQGCNGPLTTHCRATMESVSVDCDVWNAKAIEKLEVTEEQWKHMQKAVSKRAMKVRKAYPEDHAEIHPVGYNWKHDPKGRWNARKSGEA